VIELLVPQQAGEALTLNPERVLILTGGSDRCVEFVSFTDARVEGRIE
jgi:hypothetical protein